MGVCCSNPKIDLEPVIDEGETFPLKGQRIAIIGAGPSSLHIAHLLRMRGYTNLTFFEKSDRYGGKTVTVPHQSLPGVVHELGTCYMHPAYDAVRELAAELGVGDELPYENMSLTRAWTSDPALASYTKEKGWMDFEEWILATVEKDQLGDTFWLYPDKVNLCTVFIAVLKYSRLHCDILGSYQPGNLPPRPSAEQWARIDKPFVEFIREHDLDALLPLFGYVLTAQGYGTFEVPAFYAMVWITPALVEGLMKSYLGGSPVKAMFVRGFAAIWEAMVELGGFDIRYNTNVARVERSNNCVMVAGTDVSGAAFEEQFDYLIVGAPLANCGEYIVDLDAEEKELFGALTNYRFRTTLFERDSEPTRGKYHLDLWIADLLGPGAGTGEVFALRDTAICFGNDASEGDGPTARREQMCYQFVAAQGGPSEQVLEEKVDQFFAEKSITGVKKLRKGHEEGSWKYFFHYPQAALNAGFPWRLLHRQGRHRTLWVHASASFESVLNIVHYNNTLCSELIDPWSDRQR